MVYEKDTPLPRFDIITLLQKLSNPNNNPMDDKNKWIKNINWVVTKTKNMETQ